jgi:hypothetical protein
LSHQFSKYRTTTDDIKLSGDDGHRDRATGLIRVIHECR